MRKPSPRRRLFKWAGLAACLLLTLTIVLSRWWSLTLFGGKFTGSIGSGLVDIGSVSATWYEYGWQVQRLQNPRFVFQAPVRYYESAGSVAVKSLPFWALTVSLWPWLVIAIIATLIAWWRDRRFPEGHCKACGYDLTGNVSGACSECGFSVAVSREPEPPLWKLINWRRLGKRVAVLIGCVLLVLGSRLAWRSVKAFALSRPVVWQAENGGLTLRYVPSEDVATIFAGNDYVKGRPLTWTQTDPGATRWLLVAPVVPPPQMIVGRAGVGGPDVSLPVDPEPDPKDGLPASSARGLAALYVDGSNIQRFTIVHKLEWACGENPAFCDALKQVESLVTMRDEIGYVHDLGRFKDEGALALSADEAETIVRAREYINRLVGRNVRATFKVAAVEWGYQVDFRDARCRTVAGDEWEGVSKGFGAVFFSRDFDIIDALVGAWPYTLSQTP